MYQHHLITTASGLQQLQHDWNALVAAHSFPSIFLTYEWLYTWWQEVGSKQGDTQLYVLLIVSNGRPVGIAPFMEKRGGNGNVLHFLGDPYTDYHDVIAPLPHQQEVITLVLNRLQADRSRWSEIHLNCIPAGSCFLTRAGDLGWLQEGEKEECPVVQFSDPAHYKQLINKKGQARNSRLLASKGALLCDHYFSYPEINSRFESYRHMHLKQWSDNPKAVGGFEDPLVSGFFAALIPALAPQHWLMFTELTLGGQPLSYYFSFLYVGRYFAYRPCYDTTMAHYSPGHIMLNEIISYLHSRSCYTLDFLRGNYAYKYRYANNSQFTHSLSSRS